MRFDFFEVRFIGFLCYNIIMRPPLVIAHRGDSSQAPENSLESLRRALALPVDMIELDIRKSRDNGLYVMHDRMTGRTAEKNIDIERATSEKIAGVKLKHNGPIPALPDALGLVAGACGLNLEIKSAGAGALTADYLLSSGYTGDVLISSFQESEVVAVRKAMPSLPTSLIFDFFSVRDVPSYKEQGYTIVSLRSKTVSEKLVAACHEGGIHVFVWTVDGEDEMRKFISWGVDGIYSNNPGVLKKIIGKMEISTK